MGNCTTSVTYHPWNKRTQNVELRTCVLLALERASVRACVRACVRECVCFFGAFRRFGVFGGGGKERTCATGKKNKNKN
jgi:hypothetical protein